MIQSSLPTVQQHQASISIMSDSVPSIDSSSMSPWESIQELASESPSLASADSSFLSAPTTSDISAAAAVATPSVRTSSSSSISSYTALPQRGVSKAPTPPPIPDLRFEQTYRRSIADADTWWKVVLITIKDQLTFPLIQGLLWNMVLVGVKSWRIGAAQSGNTWGSKLNMNEFESIGVLTSDLEKLSNWWAQVNDNKI